MMQRYQQLLGAIEQLKPKTIVEIGTWNGERAINMALAAIGEEGNKVHYQGFDLFEGASKASDEREFNVKSHVSIAEVRAKLDAFVEQSDGKFTYGLTKGNTKTTLKKHLKIDELEKPVLCFIDGGHSIATIRSDLKGCSGADLIILDDYYQPDDNNPDITKVGCNKVLESLGEMDKDYFIMPVGDPVKGGGEVYMATVGRKIDVQISKKVQIKTKNSVSDDAIQRNILYAQRFGLPVVQEHHIHHEWLSNVSGGPGFLDHLKEIRQDRKNGHYIGCVKTSHDPLIENGIVPDFCMLLDPRAHVVDFIENPHLDVKYLVASQVYWETIRHLIDKKANVELYHALVKAGEEAMLDEGASLLMGGSTSATRGLSVYYYLGFRHMKLYGYDSYFKEDPGKEYKEKHTQGGKMLLKAKIYGEEWLTTAELIAQVRDFEGLIKSTDVEFEVVGEGLIPHVWNNIKPDKQKWIGKCLT